MLTSGAWLLHESQLFGNWNSAVDIMGVIPTTAGSSPLSSDLQQRGVPDTTHCEACGLGNSASVKREAEA